MRVCLLPADFSGPGCYRVLFPGRQLRLHGHEALTPPWEYIQQNGQQKVSVFGMHKFMNLMGSKALAQTMADKFLSLDCDVYVFHQQSNFYFPYVVRQLRNAGRTVISETDDFHLGLPWYHPSKDSPEGRSNFKDMFHGYAGSNAITVTTPFLAEAYSRYGPTHILPNYLDWEMWEDIEPYGEQEHERIRLGWFGAVDLRAGDMMTLSGIIGPWLERHPEVDLLIRTNENAEQAHDLLGTPKKQRLSMKGSGFPDGIQEIINSFDIGLVPLEMNNFNEAKSNLKGMEMNACGIPYIASATQSYKDYTEEGVNGLLARRPKDWIRALDTLLDSDVRARMQVGARATAKRNTIQRHWQQWERVYEDHLLSEPLRISMEAISRGAIQKDLELASLVNLVQELRPRTVLEIGTAKGGTFWAWCQVASDDATLISIDLPGGDYAASLGPDGYGARDLHKLKAYAQGTQSVHPWLADSQKGETRELVEKILDGRTIDFLFIDGDHSYEGVKRDFELWSPLVDGLIAFHDIVYHTKMKSDVPLLWSELKGDYEHHEFVSPLHNDLGIGIWGGIGVLEHVRERSENTSRQAAGAAS